MQPFYRFLIFTSFIALLSIPPDLMAQEVQNTVNPDGYNVFYYPNGVKSSEGNFRNGKPDGYWKTYFENGVLK